MSTFAYIGLGSNLQQPLEQIVTAITALDNLPATRVRDDSGYYSSQPMGPKDQPDFINAVVKLETGLSAVELLERCQMIEQQQGRIKTRHWGERCIDIDILIYADLQVENDELTLPHPGICRRDFVFKPLLKVQPDISVPGIGPLKDHIASGNARNETNITDYSCRFAGNIDRVY